MNHSIISHKESFAHILNCTTHNDCTVHTVIYSRCIFT